MVSRKVSDPASIDRARRLRGALGLHAPTGLFNFQGAVVAWYEWPGGAVGDVQAQPVVCLHGLGSGSREFAPLRERVPHGVRLILLDWPGHGRSGGATPGLEAATELLRSFLAERRARLPILLGCEFGGAVALSYAAAYPDGVSGLVLCQPAGLVERQTSGLRFLGNAGKAGPMALRQALRLKVFELEYVGIRAQAESELEASMPRLRACLQELACPVLFTLSRDDRRYRLSRYLKLLDSALCVAPQHRITVFSGRFHPIWDESERFAQALCGFVQARVPLHLHEHAWILTAVDWPTRSMNLWRCVHPECAAEQVLGEGEDANRAPLAKV